MERKVSRFSAVLRAYLGSSHSQDYKGGKKILYTIFPDSSNRKGSEVVNRTKNASTLSNFVHRGIFADVSRHASNFEVQSKAGICRFRNFSHSLDSYLHSFSFWILARTMSRVAVKRGNLGDVGQHCGILNGISKINFFHKLSRSERIRLHLSNWETGLEGDTAASWSITLGRNHLQSLLSSAANIVRGSRPRRQSPVWIYGSFPPHKSFHVRWNCRSVNSS